MTKTITLRLDEEVYNLIKTAAKGEMRTISNFIEHAAVRYLTDESFVSDVEMDEILENETILKALESGKKDIEKGKYKIV